MKGETQNKHTRQTTRTHSYCIWYAVSLYHDACRVPQEQLVRPQRKFHGVWNLRRWRIQSVHLALRQLEQVYHAVRRRVAADCGGKPSGVDVADVPLLERPCCESRRTG